MTEFETRMADAKKHAAELGLDEQAEFENFEARALAHDVGLNDDADVAMPRDIDVITEEIVFYKRQAGSAILEIGSRLNEAKSQLEHGQWLDWLREKVDLSERSAQNFMRLSREYGKSAEIADLGATKALALLALPESDRMNFAAEKHAVNGEEKSVGEMTSKELEQAIRERDAALAAQKTAETALSDAREKAEDARKQAESAKAERDALSAKSDGLEEKLRKAKEREKNARFAAEQADASKMAAERALRELREKPVDVAVAEPDQAVLDKLRADAEAAATEKVRQAEEQLRTARKQAEDAAAEADAMKKRLAIADPLTTEFQVYFNDWQKVYATVAATLGKFADAEKKEKLRQAVKAVAERMGNV